MRPARPARAGAAHSIQQKKQRDLRHRLCAAAPIVAQPDADPEDEKPDEKEPLKLPTLNVARKEVVLQPLKVKEAALSIGLGLAIRFLLPCPEGVTMQAWSLLAIFISTIAGIVLNPLPIGAWAFFGLTTAVVTKTLSFQQAFSAFSADVIWLIVIVSFFARGFAKTGLGDRAGYLFAKTFGKTTLGLAYALSVTEAVVSPGLPSSSARHGGVMLPIITSLSRACGSDPAKGTEKHMGAFLITTVLHTGGISSCLFMTGAAQNLLCAKLAASIGVSMGTWGSWFVAACVPSIAAFALTPYILYKLCPPEIKETPDAPQVAAVKLEEMGPVTLAEKVVLGTMAMLVCLWVTGPMIGLAAPITGMLGLCTLLATGVLTWDDCLAEKGAWNTLTWFAVLVGMSAMLEKLGLISYIATTASAAMAAANMEWYTSMAILHVAYIAVHYLFASQTAHVGALFVAFLAMMTQAGAPPMLAALTLNFSSNLFGAITHYASAQSAMYYGAGYIDLKTWWRLGATMAAILYTIFLVLGVPWWTYLGLIPS